MDLIKEPFHTGSFIFALGPRRDYIGRVLDGNDTGLIISNVYWITRVTNILEFEKNGWKAEHKKDDFSVVDEEYTMFLPFASFEIKHWAHGPCPK